MEYACMYTHMLTHGMPIHRHAYILIQMHEWTVMHKYTKLKEGLKVMQSSSCKKKKKNRSISFNLMFSQCKPVFCVDLMMVI